MLYISLSKFGLPLIYVVRLGHELLLLIIQVLARIQALVLEYLHEGLGSAYLREVFSMLLSLKRVNEQGSLSGLVNGSLDLGLGLPLLVPLLLLHLVKLHLVLLRVVLDPVFQRRLHRVLHLQALLLSTKSLPCFACPPCLGPPFSCLPLASAFPPVVLSG